MSKIKRPFYAKHIGILSHYQNGSVKRPGPWSMAMIAAYDVAIARTSRVGKESGIAKTSISDISRILGISRITARKAIYELIKAGYLRRHLEGYEVVNWNGTEPVGLGGGQNLTMVKKLPPDDKKLTTSCQEVVKKLPGSGKKLTTTNRSESVLKKEEKRDKFRVEASEWFFALQDETKDVIAETLERIGKTYQKGKLNDDQKSKILLRLKDFGTEVAEEACRRWNNRGYEKDAKRDNYLYGIARGVEQEWGVKHA